MKYKVKNTDDNNLRFEFAFTVEEIENEMRQYAQKNKKEYISDMTKQSSIRKHIITELVKKEYVKAAMQYTQEIYYSPVLNVIKDDKSGLVVSADVQISPVFKLGDYSVLSITENELEEIERDIATVPEDNRATIRRYLLQSKLVEKLDNITEGTVPDTMASERAGQMMSAFEQQLDSNGKDIKDYYEDCDTNEHELYEDFMKEAKRQLHSRLSLYELAKAENLYATEEEYEAELRKLSDRSMMPVSRLREIFEKKEGAKLRQDIAIAKAAEFLGEIVDKRY